MCIWHCHLTVFGKKVNNFFFIVHSFNEDGMNEEWISSKLHTMSHPLIDQCWVRISTENASVALLAIYNPFCSWKVIEKAEEMSVSLPQLRALFRSAIRPIFQRDSRNSTLRNPCLLRMCLGRRLGERYTCFYSRTRTSAGGHGFLLVCARVKLSCDQCCGNFWGWNRWFVGLCRWCTTRLLSRHTFSSKIAANSWLWCRRCCCFVFLLF